jgi:hypothetical protein
MRGGGLEGGGVEGVGASDFCFLTFQLPTESVQ